MGTVRGLALASALVLAVPAVSLQAQSVWRAPAPPVYGRAAYDEGYRRGEAVGIRDARRGAAFNFYIAGDYRRGDPGYRSQYGQRDRYRIDFRAGFEAGYRAGYNRFRPGRGNVAPGPPAWSRGRARGLDRYGYAGSNDLASMNGWNDGYEEGVNDGRKRHTDDPYDESRYRDGDRGYERYYGSKELYRSVYRRAFIEGYETGYRDGWSYR